MEKNSSMITAWDKRLKNDVTIGLILKGDKEGEIMEASLKRLCDLTKRLSFSIKKDKERDESVIHISPNLLFKGELSGKMLEIFLSLLERQSEGISAKTDDELSTVIGPVFLKLYVAPQCPHCPPVVHHIAPMTLLNKNISLEIIDGTFFSDKANQDRIQSVPTLIYDDNFRWTGSVKVSDVLDVIKNIKPEDLSPRSLQTMIESGKASALAELMVLENKIFPSIYGLIKNEKWSVRLGAMVVAEEIMARDEHLADVLMEHLWETFETETDQIKGDLIYLAGEIGSRLSRQRIADLMKTNIAGELMEAVMEAHDSLIDRLG